MHKSTKNDDFLSFPQLLRPLEKARKLDRGWACGSFGHLFCFGHQHKKKIERKKKKERRLNLFSLFKPTNAAPIVTSLTSKNNFNNKSKSRNMVRRPAHPLSAS